uniref:Uncharacterized protein n=1 Tax=Daphnia galeata TaxID=27404 RepID=A0A8J2RM47_9CRUS|nr:unnamed protein product [Daphnia galeata]
MEFLLAPGSSATSTIRRSSFPPSAITPVTLHCSNTPIKQQTQDTITRHNHKTQTQDTNTRHKHKKTQDTNTKHITQDTKHKTQNPNTFHKTQDKYRDRNRNTHTQTH